MEKFWLAVNVAAWSCWLLLLEWLKDAPLGARVWALPHLPELVAGLEAICCVEVLRMVVGDLRGSWVTGLLLHYTRVVVIATVLPTASEVLARTILVAWAATELCRYPCYVFKGSPFLLRVRSAAPVVTFPLGAGSELVACCFRYQTSDGALRSALGFQVRLRNNDSHYCNIFEFRSCSTSSGRSTPTRTWSRGRGRPSSRRRPRSCPACSSPRRRSAATGRRR